jgi:hypothetical protein
MAPRNTGKRLISSDVARFCHAPKCPCRAGVLLDDVRIDHTDGGAERLRNREAATAVAMISSTASARRAHR